MSIQKTVQSKHKNQADNFFSVLGKTCAVYYISSALTFYKENSFGANFAYNFKDKFFYFPVALTGTARVNQF